MASRQDMYELAEKYWEDKQFDLAIPIYAVSLKQAPKVYRLWRLLNSYRENQKAAEVISLVEELSTVESAKYIAEMMLKDRNPFVIELLSGTITGAAIETKQFGILDTLHEPAILRGRYYEPNRREEKVIELWENCLSNYLISSDMDSGFTVFNKLLTKLASTYLRRTLAAKANLDSHTVASYLSKLSEMLPEGMTPSQLDFPPQLWLAKYYHLDDDDAKARQMLRSSVQVFIALLSDEDDSNDEDAFRRARFIFQVLGDDKNALAALAMETRESRFLYGVDEGYKVSRSCACGCGQQWSVPSETWICKQCIPGVDLGVYCMTKFKEGKLENVCDPDHEFLEVPKWDADWLDSVPKESVPWGDQVITLNAWKQEIRDVYLD